MLWFLLPAPILLLSFVILRFFPDDCWKERQDEGAAAVFWRDCRSTRPCSLISRSASSQLSAVYVYSVRVLLTAINSDCNAKSFFLVFNWLHNEIKLGQNSFETISKQFWKCLSRFHFAVRTVLRFRRKLVCLSCVKQLFSDSSVSASSLYIYSCWKWFNEVRGDRQCAVIG